MSVYDELPMYDKLINEDGTRNEGLNWIWVHSENEAALKMLLMKLKFVLKVNINYDNLCLFGELEWWIYIVYEISDS